MLYWDEKNNKYQIIDGLQRSSTIYDFINHPAPFFNDDDIEDNLPVQLAKLTGVVITSGLLRDIQGNLISWVHNAFSTMDDVRDMQYIDYAIAFTKHFPSAAGKESEIAKIVRPTLKKFKDLCENLCTVRIPAIVIKGNDDTLPEIFERINSKGTQLSKYQIYAASWIHKYKISSASLSEFIKYNKERYEYMESDGTDIADFDSIDYMRNSRLNLFEIAYALGKTLGSKYPCLFNTKKDIREVDSLGFTLIAACLGVKNSNLKSLHTSFERVVGQQNVDLFLERVIQCVDTAHKLIGKFNRFKVNSQSQVGPLHTEFQIISLIANIFIARYGQYSKDENDRIVDYAVALQSSNTTWADYETCLKRNAWKRYCVDILNSRWKGAGDKKLDSVAFDTNYFAADIRWDDFENGLQQWYNSSKLEKREYKRVAFPQEAEKMFLAMLYLPIFSAADQADHSKYDVEHLLTKNLLRKCLDRYDGKLRLPIGCIGNLCLLPQKENRSKRDKTIYEDSSFLSKSQYSLSDLENKFTLTREDDLKWANDSSLSQEKFEELYLHYIDQRFANMVARIKEKYYNC